MVSFGRNGHTNFLQLLFPVPLLASQQTNHPHLLALIPRPALLRSRI